MILWIFLWWLLGIIVLCAATWHEWSARDLRRIELGDAIGFPLAALVWPLMLVIICIENSWLDTVIFDLDWFRKDKE